MAVDGAVVDIDLIVIGRVHQGVAALDDAGTLRQRLQDQEFRHRQHHRIAAPGAGVALGVHRQRTAFQHLGFGFLLRRRLLGVGAAQDRLDPLDQQTLRERLMDEVVGAHFEAEQFVDLLVLRGEEDHWQIGFLPQPAEQLHAVHARHLYVENGEVRRIGAQAVERGGAVGVGLDAVAFAFQGDRHRCENVAIVIDESDGRHCQPLLLRPGYYRDSILAFAT